MKQKLLFFILPLVIVSLGLGGSTLAEAVEPMNITHSLQSYSSDGSTMTVLLGLTLQNNGTQTLDDILIALLPMPKSHFEFIEEQPATVIGSLSPGETVYVEYSLTSPAVYPVEYIDVLPIFWLVDYTDDAIQEIVEIVVSRDAGNGGAQ
jgi:hypothetical protein